MLRPSYDDRRISTLISDPFSYGMGGTRAQFRFLFIYCLLVLTPFASCLKNTKIKSDCDALFGDWVYTYYYGSSCISAEVGASWYVSKDVCTRMSNGHLLTLPTMDQVNKFIAKLGLEWGATGSWTYWIGLFQNSTIDEPTGNWHWTLTNGRLVPVTVVQGSMGWRSTEPDNGHPPSNQCGVYWHTLGFLDADCGATFSAICEYDDPDQERKYRRKFKGHRGHGSSVLGEDHVTDRLACARLCTADPICHSFSYRKTDGHCIMNQDDGTHPSYPVVGDEQYDIHVWQLE